ncbi:chromate transporter [Pseudothermotoga sp.]|uniref:chromate transporter n=1 Tax=Pseudothermotoga sp. TaxID=2033661 RepID=UPI0031F612C0
MSLIKLNLIFLKLGFLSFGGGWAIVGILKKELISAGFLTSTEFAEMVSIAQMTPGPIALNLATYVGYKYFGFWGGFLNTFFFLLAPVLTMISVFMVGKNVRLNSDRLSQALTGFTTIMVLVTLISLANSRLTDLWFFLIAMTVFVCLNRFKIHPLILIFAGGFMGVLLYAH